MIREGRDSSFFFAVKHIIKPNTARIIYSIRYNEKDYYILKTPGLNDCEQLDSNQPIDAYASRKICYVLSEIEREYQSVPALEFINMDIFKVLAKMGPSLSDSEHD
ncbi:MAG: hypothetical protein JSU01_13350 [Bacteroidetes bacterium]|nr:hypothetical protein [Bacteroidota bacterium]